MMSITCHMRPRLTIDGTYIADLDTNLGGSCIYTSDRRKTGENIAISCDLRFYTYMSIREIRCRMILTH